MEIFICCSPTSPIYFFIDAGLKFDMPDDLQCDQSWGQRCINSYQIKQKHKENKPLLLELNDH